MKSEYAGYDLGTYPKKKKEEYCDQFVVVKHRCCMDITLNGRYECTQFISHSIIFIPSNPNTPLLLAVSSPPLTPPVGPSDTNAERQTKIYFLYVLRCMFWGRSEPYKGGVGRRTLSCLYSISIL